MSIQECDPEQQELFDRWILPLGPSTEEAHVASSGIFPAPSTQGSLSPTYEERYRTTGDYIPLLP